MKLMDAKELVLGLMWAEQPETARLPWSIPTRRTATREVPHQWKGPRAIHHYDGWYVPISLRWFSGELRYACYQQGTVLLVRICHSEGTKVRVRSLLRV